MSFISVLETIGKDFEKGFEQFEKYAIPAASLLPLIFPQSAALGAGASIALTAISTVQTVVTEVEQKYAAMGKQSGTGAQKLADVLTIVTPIVEQALAANNLPTDSAQVSAIVKLVVAALNAKASS